MIDTPVPDNPPEPEPTDTGSEDAPDMIDAAMPDSPGDDPVDTAAPAPAAPRTIEIGLGPGLLAVLVVTGLAIWLLSRATAAPAPPPVVVVPQATQAGPPVTVMTPATTEFVQTSDGEIAPGTVLDVANPNHPLVNASAPDITGSLLDGAEAKLSDYKGKPVLVNFWATWCPPCRLEMPWLEEAYQARRDSGLVLLAVDAGERMPTDLAIAKVRQYVQDSALSFPVLMPTDADGAQINYQAYGLPSTYLVDASGKVVEVVTGAFPNRASLNARLDAFLGSSAAPAP